jgi:ATP-dependent DNA helicase RecQ
VNDDNVYLRVLRQYFGYDSFRSIQLDIIRSIGGAHDTLGLMPTGGGKSITFQVPALTMDGVCIVVSPLVALMKDQVQHLKERGIKAEAIYTGVSRADVQRILDNAIFGAVKFLYVSPERLSNQLFLAKLHYMKVCFVTVDEAHCISQWGYDFRPSYLQINRLREILGNVPVLALTATATRQVAEDIQDKLEFGRHNDMVPQVFTMSFRRENLSYVVRDTDDKFREMMHIISSVKGSVIVYTRNREKTKEYAEKINAEGVKATFYHAGLDTSIKEQRQEHWQNDEVRVMVATNAFGMGIDKPNVRLVIHVDCPDSLEAYFQEAGRAGRDGKRAYAVLLCNGSDVTTLSRRVTVAFPPKDYIRKVYDQLAYFFELAVDSGEGLHYDFNEMEFCRRFKHYPAHLESALQILQNAGYVDVDFEPENRIRVMITVMREDLYDIHHLTKEEDSVLNVLLRHYGTLFADLTYIDKGLVERRARLGDDELHAVLKSLAQKRIIKYVPPRRLPSITYLVQRVESSRLRITRSVYETMQERLGERISKVIAYITNDNTCRERMLMEYFGEKTECDCGHCDVCLG